MISYENYVLLLFIILFLRFISIKFNFLNYLTGKPHQVETNKNKKKIPLIGGACLLIFFFLYYFYNKIFLFYLTCFFVLGIASDTKYEINPKLRFLLQFLLALCFVFFLNLSLIDLRIEYLDELLKNNLISLFFTAFCVIVLLNGSNFIDGKNTLLIGYYMIVILIFLNFNNKLLLQQEINFLKLFGHFLFFLIIFNFFEKLFMGDSGAYILSIFFSFFLINFYLQNHFISPYYIFNILWYPAFENCFSIFRKLIKKKSPFKPDQMHLHHLLHDYLQKKIILKFNLANFLSAFFINIFNFIIMICASLNIYDTKYQVVIIFFSILIYIATYLILLKVKLHKG